MPSLLLGGETRGPAQAQGQATSLPSATRAGQPGADRLSLPGLRSISWTPQLPTEEECLSVHRLGFQSTERAEGREDLLWATQGNEAGAGRKPSGAFAWMVWHHSLDGEMKLKSVGV